MTAERVLDANLNRAREAARVLEDYVRFVRADTALAVRCRSLRHAIAEAGIEAGLDAARRAGARDVAADPLAAVPGPPHTDEHAVALAGAARLAEALRSLEEFGRVRHPALARRAEALRFEAYAIEAAIERPRLGRRGGPVLYVLVDPETCRGDPVGIALAAARGGADAVQLRAKDPGDRAFLALAREVLKALAGTGVLFLVNDRVDVARAVGADGVHLGREDLPAEAARAVLGPHPLVGVSTHSAAQAAEAAAAPGVDYLAVGPCFGTSTKPLEPPVGLDVVRGAAVAVGGRRPLLAVGGIRADTLDAVLDTGAHSVALCSAVCGADDPEAVTLAIRRRLHERATPESGRA
ncbi:MAG: thiamine phosphate synthase [Planctomycetes bacterium]|nr:thiamine phosphate synthase [Planctomycetota bacterium]